jgi:hypothetical protein
MRYRPVRCLPLPEESYVFGKKFFTGWITIGFIWLSFTAWGVIVYRLWEARGTMNHSVMAMYPDVTGKKKLKHTLHGQEGQEEPSPGVATPVEKVTPTE